MIFLEGGPRKVYSGREFTDIEIPAVELLNGNELNIYPEVLGHDFFNISYKGKYLNFQARSYVGIIPINDQVAVDIRPRVPISNLARLLRLSQHNPFTLENYLRGYETHEEELPSFLEAFAVALFTAIESIREKGLYYAYRQHIEHTSQPRGRILIGETVNRYASRGIDYRVVASRFERGPDNPPNRCLKYAIWYLAQRLQRMRGRSGVHRLLSQLNSLYLFLDAVEIDHEKRFLYEPLVIDPQKIPVHHEAYIQAINLAVAVIQNKGLQLEKLGDEVSISSFLVKLDDAFEKYILAVLQRGMDSVDRIQVVDGNQRAPEGGAKQLFDDRGQPGANPDIVFVKKETSSTSYPLIIDVKYKPLKGLPDRSDLNQIIAYAVSYRTPVALIVHPRKKGRPLGLQRIGAIGETTVFSYSIDLGSEDLKEEESRFVAEIIGLASNQHT